MSVSHHRGRWQAQGAGLEVSASWSRQSALTGTEGSGLLTQLETALSPGDRRDRSASFDRARLFILRAVRAGGVEAHYIRSFPVPGDRDGRRIDIEIQAGRAFVP